MRPPFEFREHNSLTLADIGVGMSVCLAAICRDNEEVGSESRIVALADRRVSHGEYSNEDASVKGIWLPHDWFALYAGNDVSPAIPITEMVSQQMEDAANTLEN